MSLSKHTLLKLTHALGIWNVQYYSWLTKVFCWRPHMFCSWTGQILCRTRWMLNNESSPKSGICFCNLYTANSVVIIPNLPSPETSQVVKMTAYGATSSDKGGVMTTLGFQYESDHTILHRWVAIVILHWALICHLLHVCQNDIANLVHLLYSLRINSSHQSPRKN